MWGNLVMLEAAWNILEVDVASLGDVTPRLEAMVSLVGFAGFLVPV